MDLSALSLCVRMVRQNDSVSDENGVVFYPAVGKCGSLPCLPYIDDVELLCAVCTREIHTMKSLHLLCSPENTIW